VVASLTGSAETFPPLQKAVLDRVGDKRDQSETINVTLSRGDLIKPGRLVKIWGHARRNRWKVVFKELAQCLVKAAKKNT
jgi:hypothetical protein